MRMTAQISSFYKKPLHIIFILLPAGTQKFFLLSHFMTWDFHQKVPITYNIV